jgi:hypothetical protein
MSALGQKQTRWLIAMPALPPKVDICSALADVRYGPKAEICRLRLTPAMPMRARRRKSLHSFRTREVEHDEGDNCEHNR